MPLDLVAGTIPTIYRELYDAIQSCGKDILTLNLFCSLFESATLTKAILNQIWSKVMPQNNTISTRDDFYKCLAFMALAQQGKPIDDKFLAAFVNRELPIPILESRVDLEDRLVRLLRADRQKSTQFFRYDELCALDTIQVDLAAEKKGVIIRHFEYEIFSIRLKNRVSRRYNDFVALDELLNTKYCYRAIPRLPPKKTVNVDKEFIEERRQALKRYLQILCRHPIISETEILRFFLTFQGNSCADNMKATYKNTPDEFSNEPRNSFPSADGSTKTVIDAETVRSFRLAQIHLDFILQQCRRIQTCFKRINEQKLKNSIDFSHVEENLNSLNSDSSVIDRWATGPNDYWPSIQAGLSVLPMEINAVSERISDQCKRDEAIVNEHFDVLLDLLQGYQVDLSKRFEEAIEQEQKAEQKSIQQQQQRKKSETSSNKSEINLEMIAKRNVHASKCVQTETHLVYAHLEAFVYTISNLGRSHSQGATDLLQVWKSFASKISQLGQNYTTKTAKQRQGKSSG